MRKWLIGMTVVLGVSVAAESRATPLYGGYNGQSTSWVEYKIGDVETSLTAASIIFGADSNERSWVRMRVSLVPFFTRLEYTRDHLGIQSVAFNTLFPWPLQLGSEIMETPGDMPPWWVTAYLILGVGGFASDGNSWVETGIPGTYGMGADNSGNSWQWFKVGNLLQGFGEDFNPVEPVRVLHDSAVANTEKSMHALQSRFDDSIDQALAGRLRSTAFIHAAAACSMSLQMVYPSFSGGAAAVKMSGMLDPSCTQIADQLLAGDTGDGLATLVDNFVEKVQPLLGKSRPQP
jgi:hypothetical protein